jgi:hypothetical protein
MWLAICGFIRKLSFQMERERFRKELAEELETHEALKLAENTTGGLAPREAAQRTRLEMGNVTLAVDQAVDVRTFISLDQLMQDIRYAFRLLRTNFGFSLVAIISLALGIGGSTAVFSMLDALLIKPLPFGEPDRLVRITEFFPKALLVHFRQQSRTMELASVSPGVELNATGQGPAFRIKASPVSENLFAVLRVPVQIGRSFEHDEDEPGRDSVAILSHDQRRGPKDRRSHARGVRVPVSECSGLGSAGYRSEAAGRFLGGRVHAAHRPVAPGCHDRAGA